MTTFKIVPDSMRERQPLVRGRLPKNPLSLALLEGKTVFISGPQKTWGSLYTLAKHHNKQCKTQRVLINKGTSNEESGTIVYFDPKADDSEG